MNVYGVEQWKERTLPGTVLKIESIPAEDAFSLLRPLFAAAGGLSLSQVCGLTALGAATIQNWVKRGWVGRPQDKRYNESQVARIILINLLRESMQLESIAQLLGYVNGRLDDTSDDIIPDDILYGYLCAVLRQFSGDAIEEGHIGQKIRQIIQFYDGPTEDSRERLASALEVMVYACWSGWLKQKADAKLTRMALSGKERNLSDTGAL